jgi:hypothetical protein
VHPNTRGAINPSKISLTNQKEGAILTKTMDLRKTMIMTMVGAIASLRTSLSKIRSTVRKPRARSMMLKRKSQWTVIKRKRSRKSYSRCLKTLEAMTKMQREMLGSV